MLWTIRSGLNNKSDTFGEGIEFEVKTKDVSIKKSYLYLGFGLILLIGSSRLLVFGAVGLASAFGVSDIIIGLTVVAIGTSLPELASSIIAARKGESDIALGNVLGSNLFNTLAVVGIAGVVNPISIDNEIFYRDLTTMSVLTVSLFIFGYGFKKQGRINRVEGGLLVASYFAYTGYLILG